MKKANGITFGKCQYCKIVEQHSEMSRNMSMEGQVGNYRCCEIKSKREKQMTVVLQGRIVCRMLKNIKVGDQIK